MLEAACERAQVVVLDHVFFGLDKKKFDQFMTQLDAPIEPNPGLQRLLSVELTWEK